MGRIGTTSKEHIGTCTCSYYACGKRIKRRKLYVHNGKAYHLTCARKAGIR